MSPETSAIVVTEWGAGRARGRSPPAGTMAVMAANPLRNFAAAAAVLIPGFRLAVATPEVRRLYLQLLLVLFLATLGILGLIVGGLWYLTAPGIAEGGDILTIAGLWILRIAGGLVGSLAAPLLALIVVNAVAPLLGSRVFFGALRACDPGRADALLAAPGLGVQASVGLSLRRLVHFLGLTLLAFALTVVPLLGVVLGPLFQLWATSRALTWELLDPYFDARGLDYAAQRRYLRGHRPAVFGFGLPLSLLLGLPVLGPLLFGLAQASAALLVARVLEPPEGA